MARKHNEVDENPEVQNAENAGDETVVTETKTSKSIVPSKYAGKYKDGGSDEVAAFIKEQSSGKDGFEYGAFFALCRKNGIDEAKVAHYEGIVASKAHGGEGRARMTLGNMLRSKARKDGKLISLGDEEVELHVAPLPERPKKEAAEAA